MTYQIEHSILHGNLFEYHLVLSERARLISQQVLNPAQLLGDCGVSRNCPRYLSVPIDAVGVVYLGHVEVDTQRDGYDIRQQKYEAEELDYPLTLEIV